MRRGLHMTKVSSLFARLGARATAILAVVAVLSGGFVGVSSATAAPVVAQVETASAEQAVRELSDAAAALSGKDFDPGYIITDWLFYNSSAMNQAQIQAFLDAKCPTNNCIDAKSMKTTNRAATNMCPSAYAGSASETFAAIIFKVQKSCGISAKVILVTLQKEQGLLTLKNPTDLKLRKAMGMGCPDTSVCDAKYYGFFNQVYYAASQLKRYGLRTSDNVSFRTKYQIGIPYPVAYKTIATCGTRTVTVKSKATTALYYYTPYTPNPAALANLAGSGDDCSSYGNRNFWVYYNSWFGSTMLGQAQEAIDAAFAVPANATLLGASKKTVDCPVAVTACSQPYVNGNMYWTKALGAFPVVGPSLAAYTSAGGTSGALGWPASGRIAVTSASGNGTSQAFQGGTIYASAAGTFAMTSGMRAEYLRVGGPSGAYGWPTSAAACTTAGMCAQDFQNGVIHWSAATGGVSVPNPFAPAYRAAGGPTGVLKLPTSGSIAIPQNGGGFGQTYQGGSIYASAAGAFAVSGQVRSGYGKLGGSAGVLGWPTAVQNCASSQCAQTFQNGSIYASPERGVKHSTGAIDATYRAAGGTSGALGWPTSDVIAIKENGGGSGQSFQSGSIYSSAAGTFSVTGAIRAAYFAKQGAAGTYKWPTGAETCTIASCSQPFSGGTITVAGASAVGLGAPKSGVIPIPENGGGTGQSFEKGSVYVSAAGSFAVKGGVRVAYFALKGAAGELGWPIAKEQCATACVQRFQNGTIYAPTVKTGFAVKQPVLAVYEAAGGHTGALGLPASGLIAIPQNGGGTGQSFKGGSIYTSVAGTFVVKGAVRTAYFAQGGSAGVLGWPTGAATCSGAICTQKFQNGTLTK